MKHEILHMQCVWCIYHKNGLRDPEFFQSLKQSKQLQIALSILKKTIYFHVSTSQENMFKNKRFHSLILHIGWKNPFKILALSSKYLLPASIWTGNTCRCSFGRIYFVFVPWQPLQNL